MGVLSLKSFKAAAGAFLSAAALAAAPAYANDVKAGENNNTVTSEVSESEHPGLGTTIARLERETLTEFSIGIFIYHGANPALGDLNDIAQRMQNYVTNKVNEIAAGAGTTVPTPDFNIVIMQGPNVREGFSGFYMTQIGTMVYNHETMATVAVTNDEVVALMDQAALDYMYVMHNIAPENAEMASYIPETK